MKPDKDKVNIILREIQKILKEYKPNTSELQLINTRISQMTKRNIRKQFVQNPYPQAQKKSEKTEDQASKIRYKIKID